MENNKNKFPKSKNNNQCITPCFEKGSFITHPITLEIISSNYHPFCATNQYVYKDPTTGKKKELSYEICMGATTKDKYLKTKDISIQMLLPTINFDHGVFLKIQYNIHSFEDALDWIINNSHVPYNTIKRILDCAWNVYGFDIDLIDDRFIQVHKNMLRSKGEKIVSNTMVNFFKNYRKKYKKNWQEIDSHIDLIKKEFKKLA